MRPQRLRRHVTVGDKELLLGRRSFNEHRSTLYNQSPLMVNSVISSGTLYDFQQQQQKQQQQQQQQQQK